MAGSQIATSVSILNSLLGFQAMSLTNFDTSVESVIAAGSKVEIGSAFFTFSSDDTPQATTWTAITTANTAYITLTPSGTAGSQIVTSKYSDTAPVWSDSKQGWYLTAGSVIRYIGGVTKTSATQYDDAFVLGAIQQRDVAAAKANRVEEFIFRVDEELDYDASFTDGMADTTITFSELPTNIVAILMFVDINDTGTFTIFQWARNTTSSPDYLIYTTAAATAARIAGTYWMPTDGNTLRTKQLTAALKSTFRIVGYKTA